METSRRRLCTVYRADCGRTMAIMTMTMSTVHSNSTLNRSRLTQGTVAVTLRQRPVTSFVRCSADSQSSVNPATIRTSCSSRISFTTSFSSTVQENSSFNHGITPKTALHHWATPLMDLFTSVTNNIKERVLTILVDSLFKPLNEANVYFDGNFGPVDEIGGRVSLKIVEGTMPQDFPSGVYLRNGPNPRFGHEILASPFGKSALHWFEGDGMLHATYFGPSGHAAYQNKYIQTKSFKAESHVNHRLWLPTVVGDPQVVGLAYLFNELRCGKVNKVTCNTSVVQHGDHVLVFAENDLPYEIDPSTLETLGVWNWNGKWDRPCTAHPKIIHGTGEMLIFGFMPMKPYLKSAIVSSDGERITRMCDIDLERCVFCHEIGITEKYCLILDFPLTMDVERVKQGQSLFHFEANGRTRVGIMPLDGAPETIKWFDVQPNFTFHVINSFEDADEVILRGCRARVSFLPPKLGLNKEWFSRAINPTKADDAVDPLIDGALCTRAHEWRFNMKTGHVVEKDLTDSFLCEMPRINDRYCGYKNEYAYADVVDVEASKLAGMPKYGKLVKLHLSEQDDGNNVKHEFYDPGPGKYVSEPTFIPRPNETKEDDGWIITYVHDEGAGISEVHLLAADNFNGEPIARIELPQRVPYGFHGSFVHGTF